MGMPQIGGKQRQPLFDIDARSIPLQERGDGESVAEVMKSRAEMIRETSQTDLATTTDAIKAAGATIINVHKSDVEMGVYIACGTIPIDKPSTLLQRASPKPAEPSVYPYMIY